MPGRRQFRSSTTDGPRSRYRLPMSDYDNRRNTFMRLPCWENPAQDPTVLATTGFFFTGQEDIVECYSCKLRLCDWKEEHDPFVRHFEGSPNCPYLRKEHMGAVLAHCEKEFALFRTEKSRVQSFILEKWPLDNLISYEELSKAGFFPNGKGTCIQCFTCGCMRETWHKGDSALAVHRSLSRDCPYLRELVSANQRSSSPPKTPDYSLLEVRLRSFKHFPSDLSVGKEELAKSGFYLIQPPCVVRCYACSITVTGFNDGELPDKVHLKMSPNCPAVKQSSRPSPILQLKQQSEPVPMEVEVTSPLKSPPPDPSCLPPPVISEQDLHSMFGQPVTEPRLQPTNVIDPLPKYDPSESLDLLSSPHVTAPSKKSFNLSMPSIKVPPSRAVSNGSAYHHFGTTSLEHGAHSQYVAPSSILNQRVYLPPSYHKKYASPQPMSVPAFTDRQRYSPVPSGPVSFSAEASGRGGSDQCIVCFVHPKEYAILPCGHLCSCRDCSKKLHTCPVCRTRKSGAVKIYDV